MKTDRVDPCEDNMLKITSEGRKAALDLRLTMPSTRDESQGKVNQAVENIHRIWQSSWKERSTQLVFCDLSTPKDRVFSVYRDMAEKNLKTLMSRNRKSLSTRTTIRTPQIWPFPGT